MLLFERQSELYERVPNLGTLCYPITAHLQGLIITTRQPNRGETSPTLTFVLAKTGHLVLLQGTYLVRFRPKTCDHVP